MASKHTTTPDTTQTSDQESKLTVFLNKYEAWKESHDRVFDYLFPYVNKPKPTPTDHKKDLEQLSKTFNDVCALDIWGQELRGLPEEKAKLFERLKKIFLEKTDFMCWYLEKVEKEEVKPQMPRTLGKLKDKYEKERADGGIM